MPLTVTERYAAVSVAQTATTAFTPASDCTAGALVVLLAGAPLNTKYVSSVADALGNTWTVPLPTGAGADGCAASICYTTQNAGRILATTAITVTWNLATAAAVGIWLEETPGMAASPFDAAYANYESDPPIQVVGTLAEGGELLWICTANGDASNFTVGTGWTQPTTPQLTLTASCKTAVEYAVPAGTVIPTPEGHWGGAGVDVEKLAAFKPAATGPTDHLLSACGAGH